MGIYWYACDDNEKQYFCSPTDFSGYGCIKPNNPFPSMVCMKNMQGYSFDLVNDVAWELPDGYKDVTKEVYGEYLEMFLWAKEYYEREQ